MGLFDKFKNLFTEEVEEEFVEVKKEPVKVKSEPIIEKKDLPITKTEPITPIKKEEDPIKNENLSLKKEEKFVFPVYFDDKDFNELGKEDIKISKSEPVIKKERKVESYREVYNSKKENTKEEKKVFKPTPIISPVYGILDKNYYKEDIVVSSSRKNDSFYDSNKPVTIDDVRKKAFGTLEDDLEKTILSEDFETGAKHAKREDYNDDSIFNEFDFANAIEEDKKRDLTKDDLKSDIEALLSNKEFADKIDYHKVEKTEKNIKEENNLEFENELSLEDIVGKTIDDNDDIELPDNINDNNEIEKAYADSSDLNDSDLFNLIDSMYDKEEK